MRTFEFINRFFVDKPDADLPRLARMATWAEIICAVVAGFEFFLAVALVWSGNQSLASVGIVLAIIGAGILIAGCTCKIEIMMCALLWDRRVARMEELRRMQVEDL